MMKDMKPTVYMMLGVTGSGKTTYARNLARSSDLQLLSLDEEYSRLGGDLGSHKWDVKIADQAKDIVNGKVRKLINEGSSVVLDFCPWSKKERLKYCDFLQSLGAEPHIYYFDTPKEVLLARLNNRNTSKSDSQYVSADMLDDFIRRLDVPVDENVEMVSN